ncbi:replication protein A, subunit RPA32 [Metschnikowia bicuspidata var. bicuspidata NRRL YB-4993]|uniref:Replication protein A, subunit RPA32 n=1 Tax=Metschnikowia bicuspidata var. bicuspidata NRRL YB-4993 TaxID=869754 RepID=A0A1A0H7V4_9ASCO|nr:replication protein A, subunit RPA32 [Metschnikowia bicuspidata var. bicuspidata NRRL YB-4993]OBA20065.1 replication protein A, subunit RPA32 [Metschnikowia bicuspidata var. bicuspidata NRRL YB-4993]
MDYANYGNYGDGGFNTDAQFTDMNGGEGSQRQLQTRNTLSPVTIKQINDATQPVQDGEFTINKVSLNMVSFVGVVRKVENQTSAVTVTIEDGTGSVDVKKWVDEKLTTAAEEEEYFLGLENNYVYVTGALKEFNLKKAIQHAQIRPITDHNEVIYHMFYTIHTHLEAEGLLNVPKQESSSGLFVGSSTGAGEDSKLSDQDRIMSVIAANTGSMLEGVPVKWISDSLNIPENEVRNTCQYLSEQGKVYQGYDESSFLSV